MNYLEGAMGIITLLTDFGLTDEYVGVMKGVILGINPGAKIVDLTHHVPAQSIRAASFILKTSYDYFPAGTVHVAVVDPHVGSERKILAVKMRDHYFLSPDNGLLVPLLEDAQDPLIVSIANHELCLPFISHTFHGRDIFAPVAAHLSLGLDLEKLGPSLPFEDIQKFEQSREEQKDELLLGQVVWADHFGNLLTTVSQAGLKIFTQGRSLDDLSIEINGHKISGIVDTYVQAHPGSLVALIGSRGFLEIAVSMGNAKEQLQAGPGARVAISFSR
ncbi:MAG: SAM-dependent chlorinase/fluorinase [Desulfatibacillum sp.]|nr:SAM-dependent chlorinase/fluorinase [Desulfatibacillum sp.]